MGMGGGREWGVWMGEGREMGMGMGGGRDWGVEMGMGKAGSGE